MPEGVIASSLPIVRLTPRARTVLEKAGEEADQLGHSYIGTEHLLLALLHDRRGIAGQVLIELGQEQEIMSRVKAILESEAYSQTSDRVRNAEGEVIGTLRKVGNTFQVVDDGGNIIDSWS